MGEGFGVLDIGVLAVLLLSALLAVMRGFVHEVLSFSAWIGAAVVTVYAFPYAQPTARELIDIPVLADIVTGVAVFLVSLVLLTLFAKLLAELVQGSRLSAVDRLLGLLFGLARGAALVCLAWLIFAWLVPKEQRPDWIQSARTLPYLEQGASWLQELLPSSFLSSLGEAAQRNVEGAMGEERSAPAAQPSVTPAEGSQEPAYDDSTRESLQDAIETLPNDGRVEEPDDGSQ